MLDTERAILESLNEDQLAWVVDKGGPITSEKEFFDSLTPDQMLLIKTSIVDEAINSLHDMGFLEPSGMNPDGEISWQPTQMGTQYYENHKGL